MRTEIIKGIVSMLITIFIIFLSGYNTPLESYTNNTSLLFSNKEIIIVILIFIVFILKNPKLSTMIYSARKVTVPYLFFYANNFCINLLLILMLLDTNKISIIVASFLIIAEFLIATSQLVVGGFISKVSFSSKSIRIKEFLGLVTIMSLVIDGMPFVLQSWPVATILLIIYLVYVLNLAFSNIQVIIEEI